MGKWAFRKITHLLYANSKCHNHPAHQAVVAKGIQCSLFAYPKDEILLTKITLVGLHEYTRLILFLTDCIFNLIQVFFPFLYLYYCANKKYKTIILITEELSALVVLPRKTRMKKEIASAIQKYITFQRYFHSQSSE